MGSWSQGDNWRPACGQALRIPLRRRVHQTPQPKAEDHLTPITNQGNDERCARRLRLLLSRSSAISKQPSVIGWQTSNTGVIIVLAPAEHQQLRKSISNCAVRRTATTTTRAQKPRGYEDG